MAFRLSAKGLIVPLVAASLALGGCADRGVLTWEPDTPAEKAMREKSAKLQETVGEGAVSGLAIGALIGGLLGGGEGAFQGAQIGRLLGAGAGTYVKGLQAQYAGREQVLDAVAADMDATIAELEAAIADMRIVLDERRAALSEAQAESGALARQRARTERTVVEMNGAVAAAERREAFFGEARSLLAADGATDPVDPRLEALRARIAAMREIAGALAQEV